MHWYKFLMLKFRTGTLSLDLLIDTQLPDDVVSVLPNLCREAHPCGARNNHYTLAVTIPLLHVSVEWSTKLKGCTCKPPYTC